MRTIALAAILLFSCAREQAQIGGVPVADLNAQQLIDRAIQRYRNAAIYRDAGTVRTRIDQHEFVRGFKTEFRGPSRFELVLLDHGDPRYTVRMENGNYTVSTRSGSDTSRDRDTALYGATGVTSGTSTMIPPLLLEADSVSSLARLQDAHVGGADTLHGERCTRVEGTDHKGNPFIVWIGEESQLIRRTLRTIENGVPQKFENQLDYEEVSLE
ncbi:MAG TPA: hypothetical protein VGF48_01270 [Thermoanaerobaculia bacterium]|jgi:hypothetical protein